MQRNHILYFIKRPGGGRASFSIVKRTVRPTGTREHETTPLESVAAINHQMKDGTLSLTAAELQIKEICDRMNTDARKLERGQYVASEDNLKLLNKYWKGAYTRRRCQKEQAWNRLRLAIDELGPVSLLAEASEVQVAVDRRNKGNPRRQRRVAAALNQMRKWFGMQDRIELDKKASPTFKYLTEKEFLKVIPHVEDKRVRDLFTVLFYSGMRTGEAFAFPPNRYREGAIAVNMQMRRDLTIAETKNRKERSTVLLPDGREAIKSWLEVTDRAKIRNMHFDSILGKAAQKVFPNDESKWVSPHDLRHSFAVHMLKVHGMSITVIAKLLGDTVAVCEDYYLNFKHDDEFIESVLSKLAATQ